MSDSPRGGIAARLSRGFLLSLGGQFAGYALTFLVAPLYARALPPDEYGVISLTNSIRGILMLLMPVGTAGAVSYWYNLEREDQEKARRTMGGIAGLALVTSTFVLALVLASGAWLQSVFLPDLPVSFWPYGAIVALSAWLLSLQTVPLSLLATREKQGRSSVINLVLGVVQLFVLILMVVVLKRGVPGQIEAMFLYALTAAPLFIWLMRETPPLVIPDQWREVVRYCLPLLPHQLAVWTLNLSDRLIISHYGGRFSQDLGLYSFGYSVAMLMQAVMSGFSVIWSAVFLEQARTNPDAPNAMGRAASWSLFLLSCAAAGIVLCAPLLVRIIGGARYAGGARYVAPVVLAYLFQSVYLLPTAGLWHVKKTARLPVITIAAGLVNVAINLIWLPGIGVIVAAWSTAAGFAVMAAMGFLLGHRVYPLRYSAAPIVLSVILTALAMVAGQYDTESLAVLAWRILALAAFGGMGWLIYRRQAAQVAA